MLLKKLFYVSLIILVSACATMNQEECLLAEWKAVGLEHGTNGSKNKIQKIVKDCSKFDISPNTEEYNAGYQQGLNVFCTYENGVLKGKAGVGHKNVCSVSFHKDFYDGYEPYYAVSHTRNTIRHKKSSVATNKKKLKSADTSSKEKYGINTNIVLLEAEIASLERDLSRYRMELEIHKIDRDIRALEDELDDPSLTQSQKDDRRLQISELQKIRKSTRRSHRVRESVKTLKAVKSLF